MFLFRALYTRHRRFWACSWNLLSYHRVVTIADSCASRLAGKSVAPSRVILWSNGRRASWPYLLHQRRAEARLQQLWAEALKLYCRRFLGLRWEISAFHPASPSWNRVSAPSRGHQTGGQEWKRGLGSEMTLDAKQQKKKANVTLRWLLNVIKPISEI